MISQLTIEDLVTYSYIGVSDEEKEILRQVNWQIVFHFTSLPNGCDDDDINSTVCYDNISEVVAQVCLAKKYNLIEHLCLVVYQEIKKIADMPITITIVKCMPPSKFSYKSRFTLSDVM